MATNSNRRDDRRDDRDRRRSRDNRGQMSDDGWNTVASTKGRTSFDSSRLKNTFSRVSIERIELIKFNEYLPA